MRVKDRAVSTAQLQLGVNLSRVVTPHMVTTLGLLFSVHRPYSVLWDLGQWLNTKLYLLNAGAS